MTALYATAKKKQVHVVNVHVSRMIQATSVRIHERFVSCEIVAVGFNFRRE